MSFRVPAPDGAKGDDNLPLLVLPPDTVLKDGYRVNYLSSGGMSITYTAIRADERYLVKEVEAGDPKKVIALNQEKFILERLNHPLIVKVYDLFEYDGFYYMVTEYIEGETMDRLISPFPNTFIQEKVLINWALQLCDIFEYLHNQRPPVIYRDLKPRNVIKERSGRLHLIDFGIARAYKQGKSKDTEPMGSAMTASPEHYGGSQTDQRSDIYTIGATIHYLATNGKRGSDEPFVFIPVRSINPKLSESIERVIIKALEVEPAKRYHSVVEMRQALLNSREVPLPVLEPFGLAHAGLDQKPGVNQVNNGSETFNNKAMKALPSVMTAFVCLLVIFLGILIVDRIVGKGRDDLARPAQSPDAVIKSPIETGTADNSLSTRPDSSPAVESAGMARPPEIRPSMKSTEPVAHRPGGKPPVAPASAAQESTSAAGYLSRSPGKRQNNSREALTPTMSVGQDDRAGRPSFPGGPGVEMNRQCRIVRPGDQIDEDLIRMVKVYRDEKNNFDITLPVGWIIDKQAVSLDAQWGGKANVAFTHLPPPPSEVKPDIFIFLSREEKRQGYTSSEQYVEDWVKKDEENHQISSRLTQSPFDLNLKEGSAAVLDVVYSPNSITQFWQTRAVIVDSGGVSYVRGMITRGDEEKRLLIGKTMKEHLKEVIRSISVISR
ncbi:MAG: serine/threonine protein kinase [Vulcanimicrobiota bacterium]